MLTSAHRARTTAARARVAGANPQPTRNQGPRAEPTEFLYDGRVTAAKQQRRIPKRKPASRPPRRTSETSEDRWERKVQATKQRLLPLLPDIDPGDLDLILRSLLRPFGQGRRFFLRQLRPGVYVF